MSISSTSSSSSCNLILILIVIQKLLHAIQQLFKIEKLFICNRKKNSSCFLEISFAFCLRAIIWRWWINFVFRSTSGFWLGFKCKYLIMLGRFGKKKTGGVGVWYRKIMSSPVPVSSSSESSSIAKPFVAVTAIIVFESIVCVSKYNGGKCLPFEKSVNRHGMAQLQQRDGHFRQQVPVYRI